MINLPIPACGQDREQLLIALKIGDRNGKRRGYPASAAELDAVVALYDTYDGADGAPSKALEGHELDAALRVAIQDAYDLTQCGRRLAAVRAELMHGIELCPVCGISPPRVLDHHLPKASYHPLAIYVRNLIPLCGDCNQSKGAAAPADPAQRFIHPYFEILPTIQFIIASIALESGGLIAEFMLDPTAELPALLRARLHYQLGRLHLNARYAKEVNTYLAGHATALHMCSGIGGADSLVKYLNTQAEVEFRRFHRNHWRPVLLLALAKHRAFCEGAFRDVLPPVMEADLPQVALP